jgi:S1-C subfamily serine protease
VKASCLVFMAVLDASLVIGQSQLVRALSSVEVGAIASFSTQLLAQNSTVNPTSTPDLNTSLSAPEVGKIGKSIVVRIESDRSQGSGVIIKSNGDKYTVLTAFHVVANPSKYQVITPDGEIHKLGNINFRKIPDVDLATFEFQSANKYQIAKLGDSDSSNEGTTVYVAGFSARTSTVRSIYRSVDGKISAVDRESPSEGYGLIYTNDTLEGMSGGAVLNHKGELIGIHGRAETKAQSSFLGSEQISIAIGTGFNMGIPIDTFKKAESAIASNPRQSSRVNSRVLPRINRDIPNIEPTPVATNPPPQNSASLTKTLKFFCGSKQGLPVMLVRAPKGDVHIISFRNPNPAKCIVIAKRFQNSYDLGNLRVFKSMKLMGNNYICGVKYKDDPCTEKNVLFGISTNTDPNRVLRRLLNISLFVPPIQI